MVARTAIGDPMLYLGLWFGLWVGYGFHAIMQSLIRKAMIQAETLEWSVAKFRQFWFKEGQ